MFFARLILFILAISLLRSLLSFLQRLWIQFQASSSSASSTASNRQKAASGPQATTLQQDPVCGTYVSVDTSLKRIVNGKVLHFCSEECRNRYAA